MRRIVVTVGLDQLEESLDAVLPHTPGGVLEREREGGRMEIAWRATGAESAIHDALAGRALDWREEELDDDRFAAASVVALEFGGRIVVRPPTAPPPPPHLVDIVIEPGYGGFGSGEHPTTRACLELLADLPVQDDLADLGCGGGVVAIAAAKLGFDPVFAVDFEPTAINATASNAAANGVRIQIGLADLRSAQPPPVATIVANLPVALHEHLAEHLDPATRAVIASGLAPGEAPKARAYYERAGLRVAREKEVREWATLLLERSPA